MLGVYIDIDYGKLLKVLANPNINEAIVNIFPSWSKRIDSKIQQNVRKGGAIGRRTGNLAKSARVGRYSLLRNPVGFQLMLYLAGVQYGEIEEVGTEKYAKMQPPFSRDILQPGAAMPSIVPKNKVWLTVPTQHAITKALVPTTLALRMKIPGTKERKRSFIRKGMIFYRYSKFKVLPMWTLRKIVDLKPTFWFSSSVAMTMDTFAALLTAEFKRKVEL